MELLAAERPVVFQWARLFYMHGVGQNPASLLAQLDRAIDAGDATFNMSGGEQLRDYAQRVLELLQEGVAQLSEGGAAPGRAGAAAPASLRGRIRVSAISICRSWQYIRTSRARDSARQSCTPRPAGGFRLGSCGPP